MAAVKENLDILDEHNMQDIWMHEGVVYSGDTTLINDQTHKERFHPPILGAAILGLNNTACPSIHTPEYIWTDFDAQEMYLNAKPTCYVILGKPDVGSYSLGESLSKKYNCVHLCPRNMINDEIAQGSMAGKCLEFNMKHNNVCTYTAVLKMLKQKVKSPAVLHRGYVLTGFPLVTAYRDPYCYIKSMYCEEALYNANEIISDLMNNLKKKKPKPPRGAGSSEPDNYGNIEEEELEEEQEEEEVKKEEEQLEEEAEEADVAAELPKFILNTCSEVFCYAKSYYETRQSLALEQLHELFNLDLKPDVIIYITCPDADVFTRKYHKFINYKTSQRSIEPFLSKVNTELRWPHHYNMIDYENPPINFVFNPKYNCRPPLNFKDEVVNQLCNYREYVLPYIEKKVKDYDPKQVINLDGRTTTYQMMHQVSERLLIMDVKPVFIPEPLYLTEPPEDYEEFWNIVRESQVIRSDTLSFRRCPSPWFNRCPVELKKRQSVIGKPKYAVALFKHVYLMSSINNFIEFCRNPRPFLKLQYLEPTCRIIITGTRSSGKTMVATCLSWIFDTPVTSYAKFLQAEKQKKFDAYAKRIYSEILPVLEDARLIEWQRREQERTTNLKAWSQYTTKSLKKYLPLLIESLKYIVTEISEEEEEEIQEELEAEFQGNEITDEEKNKKIEEEPEKEMEAEMTEEGREIRDEYNKEYQEGQQEEQGLVKKKIKKRKRKIVREVPEPDPIFLEKFNSLKKQLSYLPILDSVADCETALKGENILQYAPNELITMTEKPELPVLGDEDVTKAITEYILANELSNEIEPTPEELTNEIIKFISTLDTERQQNNDYQEFYGKYIIDGFPPDQEYWELLSKGKLLPDYTIAIIENRELDNELMLHYLSIEKRMKSHLEPLLAAKDPLILCKLQTKKLIIPRHINIQMIIHDLVDESIGNVVDATIEMKEEPETGTDMLASFTESIEKFREDWDNIKIKLEENSKCFIEVELGNKTHVDVLEEVLLKIRQAYYLTSETDEDQEPEEEEDAEHPKSKDLLTYNNPQFLCETNIYCPYTFFNYGLLWEGKREFCLKYDNKIHYFSKEEFLEQFRKDVTRYQEYSRPFKKIPALKICVIGCAGSGLSTLSKRLAMELGLLHIHFADIINYYFMPRHYKNVGRRYENPFIDEPMEDEGVVEFQADEENPNLFADIFSNEKELRRIVYNYYERGQPILPIMMQKIIKNLWFTEPFNYTGFILDGYPRMPQDVEDLINCNCIPDVVIELESNSEIGIQRIGPLMFDQWKTQLKQAKADHKTTMEMQQKLWEMVITKTAVVRLILEELLDKCGDIDTTLTVESRVFDAQPTGSTNVDPKLFKIYNDLIEEYPKPTDTREWEKPEDVRERIDARIEAICDTEYENIQALKDLLVDNKIKMITIDGTKSVIKVLKMALTKLKHLRNRTQSFFEQTFVISPDIAELLLSQGYVFLSKFGRQCPVYVSEHVNMIHNSYKIRRARGKIFPVIHRSFVYFVCSESRVKKFRNNPLKFLTHGNLSTFHPHILGMAVIGPPKSGKSTLCAKLVWHNYFICISKGKALRYVLETMEWTELGKKIRKQLNNGDEIDTDTVMSAVQTVAIDHRTYTYGYVLDGIPSTAYEAKLLTEIGLYPNSIYDLFSDKFLSNSQNEIHYDIIKYMPPYSKPFIEYKFKKWTEEMYKIRNWVRNDYQNFVKIDSNQSKWQCGKDAYAYIITQLSPKIHSYLTNVATNCVPVKIMAISNALFEEKMTSFKNLCPACLRKNVLKHSGYPVDKEGVVQYRNRFYWVCQQHFDTVTKYPDYYLDDDIEIPDLPVVVKFINPHNVYENGVCIVTYAENLPAQILERGSYEFAAAYKSHTYLFCSNACLTKFLEKPEFYADIEIFKGSLWYPRLSLKKLPDLGYLEQTLANILTEACCSVNAVRPKYPGLSIELSAIIHIALFLKTHNKRLPKDQIEFYQRALKMYENRSKLILDIGLRMRSMENPFIVYPKCHHGTPKQYSPLKGESFGYKTSFSDSIQSDSFDKYYPSVGVPSLKGDVSPSISGVQVSSVPLVDDDDISYSTQYYSALGSVNL